MCTLPRRNAILTLIVSFWLENVGGSCVLGLFDLSSEAKEIVHRFPAVDGEFDEHLVLFVEAEVLFREILQWIGVWRYGTLLEDALEQFL
jgi:hypothetical protein